MHTYEHPVLNDISYNPVKTDTERYIEWTKKNFSYARNIATYYSLPILLSIGEQSTT